MLRNEWLAHLDGLVVFRGLLAAEPLRSLHAALAADEDALTGAVAAFEAALFARGTNWTEALLDAVLDPRIGHWVDQLFARHPRQPFGLKPQLSPELQVDNIVSMSKVKLSRREVMKTVVIKVQEGENSACCTPPALRATV